MSKEISVQVRPSIHELRTDTASVSRLSAGLRSVGIVVAGSALVAVCAHIAVPLYFTPVPLSMAPFAVLLIGLFLTPRLAATTLLAYLAEGALGLPVFSPASAFIGGVAHLFGPTGGYLLSYPLAAGLIALLVGRQSAALRQGSRGSFARYAVSAACGSIVILICGALWLSALTHAAIGSVFNLAVAPFLPGDALKIIVAAALADGWIRLRRYAA